MKPATWIEVRRVAEQALELPDETRAAFLDRACNGDADLRREVEELLGEDSRAGDFLEPLDPGEVSSALAHDAGGELLGTSIESFRLERVIASGGMGTVFEAVQEDPRRKVALKMLKSPLPSADEIRRFRFESEVLARLRHPAIAQVFEAGTHAVANGLPMPWYAMEYVEGAEDVLERGRGLPLRERIELFLEVCDAVRHGHQQGVIHRDLKPANILVDGSGRPKIIDFGVARAVESAEGASLRTQAGQVLGTLRYMSPEQIGGVAGEVDTRTDVYALGVVLFELLCGRPPFELEGLSVVEAARVVTQEQPPRPSSLERLLPSDLDWILLRALEKGRERRYGSVSELAADLRRFLADEPVLAGPPSAVYRLRKFVRRNRTLVVGTAAVLAALFLGLVGGLVREAEQREVAEGEAEKAAAVRDFLEWMLISPAPGERGRDVLMIDAIRAAAEDLDGSFAAQPEVAASLHHVVGNAFKRLGDLEAAGSHLQTAVDVRRGVLGESHPDTLRAVWSLADLRWEQQRLEEVDALLAEAMAVARREGLETTEPRLFLELHGAVARIRGDLGDMPGALAILEEARSESEDLLGSRDEVSIGFKHAIAFAYQDVGRAEEAVELLREVVEDRREVLGPDDPQTLISVDVLAWTLHNQKRCEEADGFFREALGGFRRVTGERHTDTGRCMTMFARCLMGRKEFGEAEELLREGLAIATDRPEPVPVDAANAHYRLATLLNRTGRRSEAEEQCLLGRDMARREIVPGHHLHVYLAVELARIQRAEGRPGEAERVLLDCLEETVSVLGAEHELAAIVRKELEQG